MAGDWVLMWQDTGAVFRLHLGEDLQFESVEGVGSGQLGGRWNLWGPDRFVVAFCLVSETWAMAVFRLDTARVQSVVPRLAVK